jgi:uncharacterized membrane protein
MAMDNHIRNPIEWGWDQLKGSGRAVESAAGTMRGAWEDRETAPTVRKIGLADLREVLARGWQDFGAFRTDVIFLCLLYPIVGLILARMIFGYGMLHLVFPFASGFAIIAPAFAVGLYEMSRRREQGIDTGWADAFGVIRSPALGAIMVLGLILLGLFMLWMAAAYFIYGVTLGNIEPDAPRSIEVFARDVLTTTAGWSMIVLGVGVGFLFALVAFVISVVSFPVLLDRDVGVRTAIATSLRVARANPVPMAAWGLIIAVGLVLGSIPLLIGLAVVLPVLGHATWHLYRKVVEH